MGGRTIATSSAPDRSLGSSLALLSSCRYNSRSGASSLKSCTSCGISPVAALSMAPIRNTRSSLVAASRTRSATSSTCASNGRASRKSKWPLLVKVTSRVVRDSSFRPRSFSSMPILRLSDEGRMLRRRAARPKCNSSATTVKQRNSFKSTEAPYISKYLYILPIRACQRNKRLRLDFPAVRPKTSGVEDPLP